MMVEAHVVLKELRRVHALTQSEVATYLDMSQNNYSRIEAGGVVITLPVMRLLATLYRMSLSELAARIESGNPVGPIDNLPTLPPSIEERVEKIQQEKDGRIQKLEIQLEHCRTELEATQKELIGALKEINRLKG